MSIKKVGDFEYEVVDPVTGGIWRVVSTCGLSDFGVMYAVTDALLREDCRPQNGSTITTVFSFKVESEGNQKSESQKFLETLLDQNG